MNPIEHNTQVALPPGASADQKGSVMIIVLLVLAAVAVIANSSAFNQQTAFKLSRNDQFRTAAYLSAYSEINAQINAINLNDTEESDDMILELIETQPLKSVTTEVLGKGSDEDSVFDQSVSYIVACNPDFCPSPPGYSLSSKTRVFRGWLNSRSEMAGDQSAVSSQTQAFWYLLPQGNLVTF